MSADRWLADTRTFYDTVAVSYAEQLREALAGASYQEQKAVATALPRDPVT